MTETMKDQLEGVWKTSVTDLFMIFRDAVLATIPFLEKAHIKWKDNESYDDWDNIVLSLYNNIICASLEGNVQEEYTIPKYRFQIDDYSQTNFIQVIKDKDESILAFIAYTNTEKPFDGICVAVLDKNYKTKETLILPTENIKFEWVTIVNSKRTRATEISVIL